MEFFFNPKSIAVIGATSKPSFPGNIIIQNLLSSYTGHIYPINSKYNEINGLKCYPSLQSVPDSIDLAIISVRADSVIEVVDDCISKNIPGAIIHSGGFAETGTQGKIFQDKLASKSGKIRLWGPNCIGIIDAINKHAFAFIDSNMWKNAFLSDRYGNFSGSVSLVAQSGVFAATFLVDIVTNGIMGINKVCSIGNKVDVNECDLLSYFLQDTSTSVIAFYLESFSDGCRFADLCKSSKKPIIVLKGGKSKKGAEAAVSHTASLAGDNRVSSGVLAQMGVVEAYDSKHMLDLCKSFAHKSSLPAHKSALSEGTKDRIAVLTVTGGAGILASDFIEKNKLKVADLSENTISELGKYFPDWMLARNPVDIWPALERYIGLNLDVFLNSADLILSDPLVDALIIVAMVGHSRYKIDFAGLAEKSNIHGKPVFVWLMGERNLTHKAFIEARSLGIPVFQELYRAVECLGSVSHKKSPHIEEASDNLINKVHELPDDLSTILSKSSCVLDEYDSKQVLKKIGIPTVEEMVVSSAKDCGDIASRLKFPVVLKGLVKGQVHKSDLGMVTLNIRNRNSTSKAFVNLHEKMQGEGKIIIQKQIQGQIELIAGLVRDPQFGTCVMIGSGGILAELIGNVAFAMAPLSQSEAMALISRANIEKLLSGYRGSPAVNRKELSNILIKLGEFGIAYPQIREIDINPIIVQSDGQLVAVDCNIVID